LLGRRGSSAPAIPPTPPLPPPKPPRAQEVLAVRWASDDPNPGVVAARKRGAQDALDEAALSAWDALPAEERRARLAALRLAQGRAIGEAAAEYPDTDAQYAQAGSGGGGGAVGQGQGGQAQQQWQQQQQQWPGQWQQQGQAADAAAEAAGGAWAWDAATQQWVWQWQAGAAAEQQAGPGAAVVGRAGGQDQASEKPDSGGAEEALGLLAAYGSGSDSESEESGGGGSDAAPQKAQMPAKGAGQAEDG
jgi:hypothetical protein